MALYASFLALQKTQTLSVKDSARFWLPWQRLFCTDCSCTYRLYIGYLAFRSLCNAHSAYPLITQVSLENPIIVLHGQIAFSISICGGESIKQKKLSGYTILNPIVYMNLQGCTPKHSA